LKILNVTKDNSYLYIETDEGFRKQSLKWRGIDALEAKCISLIGREVTHSTWGDWNPEVWFQDVTPVDQVSPNQDDGYQLNSNDLFKTDLKFDVQTVKRIYGPPGTGKTTTLINLTNEAIRNGLDMKSVGYFAFTNIAANEALGRISEVLDIPENDFVGFSTLHSLSTKIGGASGKQLCTQEELKKFDLGIGAKEEWMKPGSPSSIVVRPIHPVLDAYSLKLNTLGQKIEYDRKSASNATSKLSQFFVLDEDTISEDLLLYSELYYDEYIKFKDINNLVDFNDVVVNVVSDAFPNSRIPSFELLIIDEAQDLTKLQWKFVEKLTAKAKKTILAGDDDQAIMAAFGASPQSFNEYPVTEPDLVLDVSYRVPVGIKSFVDKVLLPKIKAKFPWRKDKKWHENPNTNESGTVVSSYEDIIKKNGVQVKLQKPLSTDELIKMISNASNLEWLIMAPTKATCDTISVRLKALEVPHYLHRRDILNAKDSKISIQTVHTSKGMGADNAAYVVQSPGDKFMDESDPRLRYVAITRAKKCLYLVS